MKIGVIGTGTIASAVINGIACDGHTIIVSERGKDNAHTLAQSYDSVTIGTNQQVIDDSDVIFLGLMPDIARDILPLCRFREGQIIISFIADIPLEALGELIAPATAQALMLPYPNIAQGGSVIPMIGEDEIIKALFTPKNSLTILADQREMDMILCAQAVLSPAAKLVHDAAKWLSSKGIEEARGEPFLRHLIASNLAQAASQDLLEALNTEGGYNQRLRQYLDEKGLADMLHEGLDELANE